MSCKARDGDLVNDLDVHPALELVFASDAPEFTDVATAHRGRILGVFAYSAREPELPSSEAPSAWVSLPVCGADVCYETWISSEPVRVKRDAGVHLAVAGDLLFGSMVLEDPADDRLEARVYSLYSHLFDRLDREGFPHLLRVWNYFSRINDDASGIERYRAFNVGRHEAFCDKDRTIAEGVVPAACALGSRQGDMVVGFLAGRAPGVVIENPRQTNAYRYPREFGPRSPTFSRGILIGDMLLISGTASIVGSRTMHPNEIALQLDETLRNLETTVSQARHKGFRPGDRTGLCLNVYLRHAADYPIVRSRLDGVFGDAGHIAYIVADLCRADLLVEIEAFWLPVRT